MEGEEVGVDQACSDPSAHRYLGRVLVPGSRLTHGLDGLNRHTKFRLDVRRFCPDERNDSEWVSLMTLSIAVGDAVRFR
jgi:hypothetical protein